MSLKVDIEKFGGPKRPQSGYFLYLNDHRAEFEAQLGTKAPTQIAKHAGEKWSAASEDVKAKYTGLAQAAKDKYENEMDAFKKTPKFQEWKAAVGDAKAAKAAKKRGAADSDSEGDGTLKRQKTKGKRPRAEGQPKRPQSAYFLWMNAVGREQVKAEKPGEKLSIGDIGKRAGEVWASMDPAGKREWEEKAKEAKEQYETDMKAFKDGQ